MGAILGKNQEQKLECPHYEYVRNVKPVVATWFSLFAVPPIRDYGASCLAGLTGACLCTTRVQAITVAEMVVAGRAIYMLTNWPRQVLSPLPSRLVRSYVHIVKPRRHKSSTCCTTAVLLSTASPSHHKSPGLTPVLYCCSCGLMLCTRCTHAGGKPRI